MKSVCIHITCPLSTSLKNDSFVIHCVDSHLKENGNWYSRFDMGPFTTGSSLQIGTRLRRSLHNDLIQVFVSRIELEGITNEFARLSGVYDPILDLLFQFRKVALYAPFLKASETRIIPILIFGSGTFYAKDIRWPRGIECNNPHLLLFTLAKGATMRGHVLIQKNGLNRYIRVIGETLGFQRSWKMKCRYRGLKRQNQNSKLFTWISLGNPIRLIQRRGFRVETEIFLNEKLERLNFEMITNGSRSPRDLLYDAVVSIFNKFLIISYQINSRFITNHFIKHKNHNFYQVFLKYFNVYSPDLDISIQTFYRYFQLGFFNFNEPLSLDLGNLDLTKERYCELRNLGFYTLGHLIEGLVYETNIFSPILKQQRKLALFKIGLFIIHL